ncbi:MAG: hypothetical protein ACK4GT_22720, partial [Pararhodobacter sp.]
MQEGTICKSHSLLEFRRIVLFTRVPHCPSSGKTNIYCVPPSLERLIMIVRFRSAFSLPTTFRIMALSSTAWIALAAGAGAQAVWTGVTDIDMTLSTNYAGDTDPANDDVILDDGSLVNQPTLSGALT